MKDGKINELEEKINELTDDLDSVIFAHSATTDDLHHMWEKYEKEFEMREEFAADE